VLRTPDEELALFKRCGLSAKGFGPCGIERPQSYNATAQSEGRGYGRHYCYCYETRI
jgi:hypothetical protein